MARPDLGGRTVAGRLGGTWDPTFRSLTFGQSWFRRLAPIFWGRSQFRVFGNCRTAFDLDADYPKSAVSAFGRVPKLRFCLANGVCFICTFGCFGARPNLGRRLFPAIFRSWALQMAGDAKRPPVFLADDGSKLFNDDFEI